MLVYKLSRTFSLNSFSCLTICVDWGFICGFKHTSRSTEKGLIWVRSEAFYPANDLSHQACLTHYNISDFIPWNANMSQDLNCVFSVVVHLQASSWSKSKISQKGLKFQKTTSIFNFPNFWETSCSFMSRLLFWKSELCTVENSITTLKAAGESSKKISSPASYVHQDRYFTSAHLFVLKWKKRRGFVGSGMLRLV